MQRNLDEASKPRQLEYVTTTTEASGQEQIFRSTCLQAMASFRLVSRERFACLPRVGLSRLDAYFHPFSQAIAQFASEHGLTTDLDPEEDTPGDEQRTESAWGIYPSPTQRRTAMLYRAVRSVQEIAEQRVLSGGTVIEHLCAMIEAREHIEWERLALAEQYTRIVAAIELFQSPQLGRQRTLALSAPTEGEYTDGNRKGQVDIQRAPVR